MDNLQVMSNRSINSVVFSFSGRSSRANASKHAQPEESNHDTDSSAQSGDLVAALAEDAADVRFLQDNVELIEREIAAALNKHAPEPKFAAQISFHRGSIEWSGVVTSLATAEFWQTVGMLGGSASLAQIIGSIVKAVVGKRLPSGYSSPSTKCTLTTAPTNVMVGYQVQTLKIALNALAVTVLQYFVVQIKYMLRKIRHLPYLITGANPYAFSAQGNIVQTIYSKVSVRLFGWASLFVVIYVTIASQKIVKEFGIFGESRLASAVFSVIAGVIVFYCDRFILSFPKVKYRLSRVISELAISKATGSDAAKLKAILLISRLFTPNWLVAALLAAFRIFLALIISGLLISTIIIGINQSTIAVQITFIRSEKATQSLSAFPGYQVYQTAVQEERRAYFNAEANKTCRQIAARGVRSPKDNTVTADARNMSGAYRGAFGVDISEFPPDYDCGVSRTTPCLSASPKCPEYGRIMRDQDSLDRKLVQKVSERRAAETPLSNSHALALQSSTALGADFSTKLQALARVYKQKLDSGTLWYELFNIGPFLIILLIFELIPAIAKIFFPPSAYDYLVAKEDFYQQLNSSVPKTQQIKDLIGDHFGSAKDAVSIAQLRKLDVLEKEKDDELKAAIEAALDKLTEFFDALVSVLGFPLTAVLTAILLLSFLFFILNGIAQAASVFTPLFDFSHYFSMAKKQFGY